jgi:dihydrofolate reductase
VNLDAFDKRALHSWREARVQMIQGDSWDEIGERTGRLGYWDPMRISGHPGQSLQKSVAERSHYSRSARMSLTRIHNLSISLDGFATGEPQSADAPFGHAGERLHEWMFGTRFWDPGGTAGVDDAFAERHSHGIGAEIMGANKFGPPGWRDDPDWKGWWGPNPPFHTPTFVLTHRPRPSIEMEGGTTFHFLDAAPSEALETAREAADGQDVRIGGGPTVVRGFLAARLVDHMHLVQVPIVLGRGVRIWDGLEALEDAYDVEAVSSPSGVTHLTFTRRVVS